MGALGRLLRARLGANYSQPIQLVGHSLGTVVSANATSDLEYTLTVTDTTTGAVETYANPAARYLGGIDPDAF